MFGKRDRSGPELLATRGENRRIQARAMRIGILIANGHARRVHLALANEASAFAHMRRLPEMCGDLDITVARLAEDSDRAEAYRAKLVVGTVEDFTADLGREEELGIARDALLYDRKADDVPAALTAAYRKAVST